ncbi:MAG: hypothetical protein GY809_05565 [Planctomycetes bacterium]|nr:hypothetical protein [Planctomycetota bacterium]
MTVADESHAMTLVSQLVTLLDAQIVSAENGQFERIEDLLGVSSALAHDIVEARAFDFQSCQSWQGKISKRYQRLELMLASAKANTEGELKHAKNTSKMLALYRSANR